MTTAECARVLGVSVTRVRAMLARGQIEAIRHGAGNRATWEIYTDAAGKPITRKWRPGRPGRRRTQP